MKLMGFLDWFRRSSAADDRRAKARMTAGSGTSVLIVDDSSTVVITLRKMLQQSGYVTHEAYNAENGLEIARQQLPNVIFLDIVLPGMNGFAALRKLRRDPSTASIPIIMMSGNEQATEQFWAQKIGADDFMKKPFSRAEVFQRMERVLAVRAQRAADAASAAD